MARLMLSLLAGALAVVGYLTFTWSKCSLVSSQISNISITTPTVTMPVVTKRQWEYASLRGSKASFKRSSSSTVLDDRSGGIEEEVIKHNQKDMALFSTYMTVWSIVVGIIVIGLLVALIIDLVSHSVYEKDIETHR